MTRIRIEKLWLWFPAAVILWRGMVSKVPLLDFWWHLKTGEVICRTRSIPRTDLFSFTAGGKPFVVQNWLAEASGYLAYRAGGLPLVVFLNALLLVAVMWAVYSLCRESSGNLRLSAVVAVLASLTLPFNARPQVFSFALIALFYWILEGYRHRRRDLVWTLPPLMLLWVNLHGAFVVGLGLIALYLACESIRRLFVASAEDLISAARLRKLLSVLGVCIAATFVNPETYRVYDYIRVVLSDGGSRRYVSEWQPPRVDTFEGVFLFYALFFLTLLTLLLSARKPGITDVALFLGFSVFAMSALRNTTWFAIVAAPLWAKYLTFLPYETIDTRLASIPWLRCPRDWFLRQLHADAPVHYRFNFLLVCMAVLILVLSSPWVRPASLGVNLWDSNTPVGAMDFMERQGLEGRTFHPQIYGDYLIWRLWPRQRSFFDGRVHLFGEPFVREYQWVFYDSHWTGLLDSYRIRYLLLSKDPRQETSRTLAGKAQSSSEWTRIYEDDNSWLFERNRRFEIRDPQSSNLELK